MKLVVFLAAVVLLGLGALAGSFGTRPTASTGLPRSASRRGIHKIKLVRTH